MRINKRNNTEILIDSDFNWIFDKYNLYLNQGYVICKDKIKYEKNPKEIYLHRLIMGLEIFDGINYVDHINGNKLDNRKENLRIVTKHQNNLHKTKTPRGENRNVYPTKIPGLYAVAINYNNKIYRPGRCFKNIEEARLAAKELRKSLYKEFS